MSSEQPKESKKKHKKSDEEAIMSFGKYRGRTLNSIVSWDRKYAEWLFKQEFLKKFEDIYAQLERLLEEK